MRPGSPGAVLAGRIEELYRGVWILTFGGGTNELQRDIIGWAGLAPARREAQEVTGPWTST
ncbi:MAG: acyl-CoA dehydrogenase family protein [Acidimicrobiales bacterium]